jgi:hypothetical protein
MGSPVVPVRAEHAGERLPELRVAPSDASDEVLPSRSLGGVVDAEGLPCGALWDHVIRREGRASLGIRSARLDAAGDYPRSAMAEGADVLEVLVHHLGRPMASRALRAREEVVDGSEGDDAGAMAREAPRPVAVVAHCELHPGLAPDLSDPVAGRTDRSLEQVAA